MSNSTTHTVEIGQGTPVRMFGARGFKGVVIEVIASAVTPYRVRWQTGGTGWCKAEDLEVITKAERE